MAINLLHELINNICEKFNSLSGEERDNFYSTISNAINAFTPKIAPNLSASDYSDYVQYLKSLKFDKLIELAEKYTYVYHLSLDQSMKQHSLIRNILLDENVDMPPVGDLITFLVDLCLNNKFEPLYL
jgi:hypothetical protein